MDAIDEMKRDFADIEPTEGATLAMLSALMAAPGGRLDEPSMEAVFHAYTETFARMAAWTGVINGILNVRWNAASGDVEFSAVKSEDIEQRQANLDIVESTFGDDFRANTGSGS